MFLRSSREIVDGDRSNRRAISRTSRCCRRRTAIRSRVDADPILTPWRSWVRVFVATFLVEGCVDMGRPGRKRRLVLEDEYWALIAYGVGTGEACRQLGIARTTGYYWRTQRG